MTIKQTHPDTLRSPRRSGVGFCLCLVGVLFCFTGCQSKTTFLNQNDELRAQNQQLNQEVEDLQQQLALRESELAALREREGTVPIDGVEPPRIVAIIIGTYSGGIDTDADGQVDELRVYLRPVDQQGRFMSAAGSARVRLIHTPVDGDPVTLLDQFYDPEAFQAAYRSGFTGTHYTLGAELPERLPGSVMLHVSFKEAGQGLSFVAQRDISLRLASPAERPDDADTAVSP